MKLFRKKGGFTFIELIMVIAVLGILAVVAIPKYQDLTTQVKTSNMKRIIAEIRFALAVQYAKNAADGNAVFPNLDGTIFPDGQVPKEVINDSNNVVTSNENPIITFSNKGGYIYNKASGEVRFDVTGYTTY